MNIQKIVGHNFSKIRHQKGLTQQEVAKLSGMHRSYISSLENGHQNPTVSQIKKLADALDVNHVYLFQNVL